MCRFVVVTRQLRPSGGTVQTDIDPRSLIGRKAFDRNGAKIGTVDEVYLDDATGEPEWAAVRTGLFSRDAFVPLEPSKMVGDSLHIPYDRKLIKDAPDFGVGRHLSPEQELQLYHHYRLDISSPASDSASPAGDTDFGRIAGADD
ncbi:MULTISPECIES: PRC-barrel domain-containing protein [Streptomyces]|uniref:PRC-barrel domain-containing protein n=1 Tax=Streptomyces yunnanensis TaxID=156453 RepID=A0ABY8AM96_9ACTN|nr:MULTISPECIES: PRC-barrel domain-containing protein [Streptomyces]QRX90958.1 PRC-barrel domain-containing protein [Streptomyces noursei]UJB40810.1 PRC-barrel domain-containing protein [Streptomyces sp. A1-5]WEB46023.1 PRC-barrel domain-containing protein [Streptomyces yunnanensis]